MTSASGRRTADESSDSFSASSGRITSDGTSGVNRTRSASMTLTGAGGGTSATSRLTRSRSSRPTGRAPARTSAGAVGRCVASSSSSRAAACSPPAVIGHTEHGTSASSGRQCARLVSGVTHVRAGHFVNTRIHDALVDSASAARTPAPALTIINAASSAARASASSVVPGSDGVRHTWFADTSKYHREIGIPSRSRSCNSQSTRRRHGLMSAPTSSSTRSGSRRWGGS